VLSLPLKVSTGLNLTADNLRIPGMSQANLVSLFMGTLGRKTRHLLTLIASKSSCSTQIRMPDGAPVELPDHKVSQG
jgi:hypothetical protein